MRKIKTSKSDKPTNKPSKAESKAESKAPVIAKPAAPIDDTENRVARRVAYDSQTIAAMRTHFEKLSARDEAYLALYASVADNAGKFTLADLAKLQTNPYYAGSAKASDAGAINRARKAGNVNASDDCRTFTLTSKAYEYGRNVLAKHKAAQ